MALKETPQFYGQRPLLDVARELVRLRPSQIENSPREYRIRNITPEALRILSRSRFENMIAEDLSAGTLVLSTGQQHIGMQADILRAVEQESGLSATERPVTSIYSHRQRVSRFSFHNHPNPGYSPLGILERLKGFNKLTSTADIEHSRHNSAEIDILASHGGITLYKTPQWESTHPSISAVLSHPFVTVAAKMDALKQIGVVRAFIPWGDNRLNHLCEFMNDSSILWDDVKHKIEDPV